MKPVYRSMFHGLFSLVTVVALTFVCSTQLAAQARIAPEKFIPSFAQAQNPDCPYDRARIVGQVAKFDMLAPTHIVFDRCFALDGKNSWQTLKTYNPDQLIFVYINGPGQFTFNQAWPLRVSGTGLDWVQANHGTNAADRWTSKGQKFGDYLQGSEANGGYHQVIHMNLLNTNWLTYWQGSFATWNGRANPYYGGTVSTAGVDGIFSDNSNFPTTPTYQLGHTDVAAYLDSPTDYSGAWTTHNMDFHNGLLNWVNYSSGQLAKDGLKLIPNWFFLNYANGEIGPLGWAETDKLANPPFAGMAEGANAIAWGHAFIFDNTYNDLASSIATMRDTHNTKILYDNSIRSCATDMSGNYGAYSTMSCWDILWYTMGSFLEGFDTELGNAYFGFALDDNVRWFDELDPAYLHLGHQVGTFTNNNSLFTREFEDGWVVVNGTLSTKSGISVPGGGTARVIDHSNFKNPNSSALVSSFSLAGTRAIILLKPGRDITNADNPVGASAAPAITTNSLPRGLNGAAYSSTVLSSGGTSPYTWSIVSGSLPNGLTRTGAVVSGTPTASGTFNFTVRLTDSTSPTPRTVDQALTIQVYTRAMVSSDTFTTPTTACVNAYSSNWILTNDGGTVNCVKVDATNGVIYGSTDSYAGWIAQHTAAFTGDQYASLKIAAMPADSSEGLQFVGVGARIGTSTGGSRSLYEVVLYKAGTTQYTSLVKILNGVTTTLASTTNITWAVGNRIEIEASGSTISALKDGVVINSYVDSTPIAGGKPGMIMAGGTGSRAAGDDFIGGDLTTGVRTNQAPMVNAGSAQSSPLSTPASLTATASDDGLPNGTLTYVWSVVSGTGVTFTSPNSASTQVSFTSLGARTLRVTANDGLLSSTSDVTITATATVVPNRAPVSNAGADQTVTLPATASLTAAATTDDGLPTPSTLTYLWSVVSGTGVTFSSPDAAATSASFAAAGSYTLRVTVSDGSLSSTDDVLVSATDVVYSRSQVSSDTFTTTTTACLNTYSPNWVLINDGGLVNCVKVDATNGVIYGSPDSYAGWIAHHVATFSNDQYASLKIAAMPADGSEGLQFVGVGARIAPALGANRSLYEVVLYKAGTIQYTSLVKILNGVTSTLLSTTSVTWSVGNRIEIEAAGSTIKALKDGVVIHSYVDPNPIAGGKPGMIMAGGTSSRAAGDDFIGGNLTTAPVTNLAPVSNAGPDQTIVLPASAALTAVATADDGLPTGSALTYVWSVVSGTGVTFTSPNSAATQVSFAAAGPRTLRVTMSDGLLSSTDDVTISVSPAPANLPPVSAAGPDQTITLPATTVLTATATDDGLPTGTLIYLWSVVSGSGVTLTSPNAAATRASFTAAGSYTLRVTVSDGLLSSTDDMIISVNQAPPVNLAPVSKAGPDQTIILPATAALSAAATTDDGLPTGRTLTYLWSVVSGTGVTFSSPSTAATAASFAAAGNYTLRVTVSDGSLSSTDDVLVSATDVVYSRSRVSSDAFTTTTTACLNTYSPNWVLINDGGLVNCVKVDATNGVIYGSTDSYAGWIAQHAATFSNDQYASLKIAAMPADGSEGLQFVGVGARIAPALGANRSLYEVVLYKAGTIQYTSLVKILNGVTSTLLSTTSVTWSVGNRIEIEAAGSTIKALKDGVVIHSYVDPNPIAGGKPGMIMAGGTSSRAAGDDFIGGNMTTTPVTNLAPVSNAGPDQTITLPASAALAAVATADDGLPTGSTLTYVWSVVSGSGVTFTSPNSAATQVSFAAAGPRTLRVTMSDGVLSSTDDVTITVNAAIPTNLAPVSKAGPDQTITLPATASLTAAATTDDGLPTGSALTYLWSVVSGTGVTFSSPNAAATSVSFAAAGSYTLRVTVSDGALSSTDDVLISATDVVYSRSRVSSDAFTTTTTACLNTYSPNWVLINDGGLVNCIKVDATNGVIYGSPDSYVGWIAQHAATFSNDQYASLKIAALPADGSEGLQFVGVGARIATAIGANRSLYEVVLYKAGTIQYTSLVKILNGVTSTLLSTTSVTWSVGNRIEIEAAGSTIKALKDGVVVHSYVDPNPIAGGKPGMVMAGGTASRAAGDDFIGGNMTTAPVTNLAPVSNAGPDQTITLPASAALAAVATADDGLPTGSTLTYVWSVVSGTGVTFTSPNSAATQVTFAAAGPRTLRVTMSDGVLSSTDDVTITVNGGIPASLPPVSNAGPDQTITLPATATLTATATGSPNSGALTYQWSVVSGVGVTLSNSNSATAQASFAAAGSYIFRVTVSDGLLASIDDIVVLVTEFNLTLVVSRNGEALRGQITPMTARSDDSRTQRMELLVDGQIKATSVGGSLSYRWAAPATSGAHTVQAIAYGAAGVLGSRSTAVNVN